MADGVLKIIDTKQTLDLEHRLRGERGIDSARETMAEKRGTLHGGGRGRYEWDGDHVGDDAGPERLLKLQRRGEGGANKEKRRKGISHFQTHMYFYKIDLDQFDGIDSRVKPLAPSVDFLESGRFIGMGSLQDR